MRLAVLLLAFILIAGCKKEDGDPFDNIKGESGISYNKSKSFWNDMKKENGNSYEYETTFTSWTGFGSTTTFKVEEGVVTERTYTEFNADEGASGEIQLESYKEVGDEVGDHEKGAKPVSIDELYESCASEFLVACPCDNTLYFETESNGLMNLCGFVPDGCQDDCYQGVRISSFSWLE
ncbi:hypothetical protein [Labilibacter marinus]|uniref:hypothetical protein n=1 Tax=Labilibacter marinus TaxID=1477105 RepID=UPI00083205FD|nr:hypothetical protein [Labilibacter marinus]